MYLNTKVAYGICYVIVLGTLCPVRIRKTIKLVDTKQTLVKWILNPILDVACSRFHRQGVHV